MDNSMEMDLEMERTGTPSLFWPPSAAPPEDHLTWQSSQAPDITRLLCDAYEQNNADPGPSRIIPTDVSFPLKKGPARLRTRGSPDDTNSSVGSPFSEPSFSTSSWSTPKASTFTSRMSRHLNRATQRSAVNTFDSPESSFEVDVESMNSLIQSMAKERETPRSTGQRKDRGPNAVRESAPSARPKRGPSAAAQAIPSITLSTPYGQPPVKRDIDIELTQTLAKPKAKQTSLPPINTNLNLYDSAPTTSTSTPKDELPLFAPKRVDQRVVSEPVLPTQRNSRNPSPALDQIIPSSQPQSQLISPPLSQTPQNTQILPLTQRQNQSQGLGIRSGKTFAKATSTSSLVKPKPHLSSTLRAGSADPPLGNGSRSLGMKGRVRSEASAQRRSAISAALNKPFKPPTRKPIGEARRVVQPPAVVPPPIVQSGKKPLQSQGSDGDTSMDLSDLSFGVDDKALAEVLRQYDA